MIKRIAIRYTFILMIITIAWTLIEHYLGYNTTNHEVGQYTRMLTAFIYYFFVGLAIWKIRRTQNGELSFNDGLKVGGLLSLLYSIGITIWLAIYGELINPEYQSSLMDFERKKMVAAKLTEAEINTKLEQVKMSSGGSVTSYLLLFLFMLLFGLVVAFIVTFILKRKKRTAEVRNGKGETSNVKK